MSLVDISQNLSATFHVGQDSTNLKGTFVRKAVGSQSRMQGVTVDVYVAENIVV